MQGLENLPGGFLAEFLDEGLRISSDVEGAAFVGEAELARGDDVSIADKHHSVDGDIVGERFAGIRCEQDGNRVDCLCLFCGILGLQIQECIDTADLSNRPVLDHCHVLEAALLKCLPQVRAVDEGVERARCKELVKLVAEFRCIRSPFGYNREPCSRRHREPWGCDLIGIVRGGTTEKQKTSHEGEGAPNRRQTHGSSGVSYPRRLNSAMDFIVNKTKDCKGGVWQI